MAHSNNIISSIKLPNGIAYEIHDAHAIHSAEELGLSAALVFKGTKANDAEILAITSAKVGDVWLATGTNTEYVCVAAVSGTANSAAWEKLGSTHDAASTTHSHIVTVTGANEASAVTGTVTIPTVSKTQKYMTASANAPTVTPTTDSVLGANTKFTVSGGAATTTKLAATASGVAVGANGTADAITGFGEHTTAAALTGVKVTAQPTVTLASGSTGDVTVATGVGSISVTASGDNVNALTNVGVAAPAITLTNNSSNVAGAVPVVSAVEIGTASASLANGVAAAQKWTQSSGSTGTPQ